MPRTNLFLKVEVEHDENERPEKLAAEMCRQLMKFHGVRVRSVELTNYTTLDLE